VIEVRGRDQRVRDGAVAGANRVGEVGEHGLAANAAGAHGLVDRLDLPGLEQPGGRTHDERAAVVAHRQRDPDVLERRRVSDDGGEIAGRSVA